MFSLLVGLLGLTLLALGVWLAVLGGTFYYLAVGGLLSVGAMLAWKRKHRDGLILLGLALLLTYVWAIVEIAGKGWQPTWAIDFAGRVGVLSALVAATGLAYLLWRTPPRSAPRRVAVISVIAVVATMGIVVFVSWERPRPPSAIVAEGREPVPQFTGEEAGAEWVAYGGTNAARRYSSLRQITTENVGQLEEAWTFRTDDRGPNDGRVFYSAQNTPIKVGDFLYTCTPSNQVFALDPATGEARW